MSEKNPKNSGEATQDRRHTTQTKNKGKDKDIYLKTVLSRLMIEMGHTILIGKKPELVEMKIKVPNYVAKIIVDCTSCHAKPGNLEKLFDVLCTSIFMEGIKTCSMSLFKNMEQHTDFIKTLDKKCRKCLELRNENNI